MRINKIAAVMCLVCLFSACTGRTDNNSEGIASEITMETTKNTDTAEPEIFDRFDGVRAMTPFYQGNTVYGETVMFIDRKDRKQLLFDPDEILSVRSYDLKTEYVRGKDYDLDKDGRLILTVDTLHNSGGFLRRRRGLDTCHEKPRRKARQNLLGRGRDDDKVAGFGHIYPQRGMERLQAEEFRGIRRVSEKAQKR